MVNENGLIKVIHNTRRVGNAPFKVGILIDEKLPPTWEGTATLCPT